MSIQGGNCVCMVSESLSQGNGLTSGCLSFCLAVLEFVSVGSQGQALVRCRDLDAGPV